MEGLSCVLYLERAIREKRIDGELAAKVNSYLDLRSQESIKWWWRGKSGFNFVNDWSIPGQFDSDARLLELAGEVAAVETARLR